jgi:hypothetical protein
MTKDSSEDRNDPVARWFDELGDAEPPAALKGEVMRTVRGIAQGQRPARRTPIGGTVMAKKILWGLATAAAIVLAIYSITGYPVLERGYEATIGAAKRYTAPQIAAPDVVLGDTAAQQFVQSEVFAELIKDPATLRLLSNAGLRQILADDALSAELAMKKVSMADLRQIASADARSRVFDDAAVRRAMADDAFVRAITDPAVAAALQRSRVADELRSGGIRAALADEELRSKLSAFASCADCDAALRNDALRGHLANAEARSRLADNSLRKLMLNAELRNALANNELAAALESDALRSALADNGFRAALRSPNFASALSAAARAR